MLLFVACVSLAISFLLAVMHKEVRHLPGYNGDSKIIVGIKAFVVSFVIIYFGLVFFAPTSTFVLKTQEIETCDPDF